MRGQALLVMACGLVLIGQLAGDEGKKDDIDLFQGDWVMVSGEANGVKIADEQAKAFKRTVKGDKITITRGGEELYRGTFKLDPTKKPKTIDVHVETGPAKGMTRVGIYELDGDTMKICVAQPEAPRPTEFTGKAGSNQTCSVWKKEKK